MINCIVFGAKHNSQHGFWGCGTKHSFHAKRYNDIHRNRDTMTMHTCNFLVQLGWETGSVCIFKELSQYWNENVAL